MPDSLARGEAVADGQVAGVLSSDPRSLERLRDLGRVRRHRTEPKSGPGLGHHRTEIPESRGGERLASEHGPEHEPSLREHHHASAFVADDYGGGTRSDHLARWQLADGHLHGGHEQRPALDRDDQPRSDESGLSGPLQRDLWHRNETATWGLADS